MLDYALRFAYLGGKYMSWSRTRSCPGASSGSSVALLRPVSGFTGQLSGRTLASLLMYQGRPSSSGVRVSDGSSAERS